MAMGRLVDGREHLVYLRRLADGTQVLRQFATDNGTLETLVTFPAHLAFMTLALSNNELLELTALDPQTNTVNRFQMIDGKIKIHESKPFTGCLPVG